MTHLEIEKLKSTRVPRSRDPSACAASRADGSPQVRSPAAQYRHTSRDPDWFEVEASYQAGRTLTNCWVAYRATEAYRLFIDELPETPRRQRTVNFVLRYAIPLFFDAPDSSPPEAAWRVTQNGHAISLSATNGGDRRFRLAVVKISDAAGKSISFGPGLVGYALGRSAMTWTAATPKPLFRPGVKVTINGLTEAGSFDAQAVVQSSR